MSDHDKLAKVEWLPPVPRKPLPIDTDDHTICISTTLVLPEGATVAPLVEPIHICTAYEVPTPEAFVNDLLNRGRYIYQRLWNRTTEAAELVIAQLERAVSSLLYVSGVSALSSLFLTFLKPGDHVVSHEPSYSGLHKILQHYLPRFNITTTTVPAGSDMKVFRAAYRPNTKLFMVESPCNPDTSVIDIEALAKLGRELNILTCIDGTFASPILQKVIPLGIDFSLHSCSKYMVGRSDVIAGCISTGKLEHYQALKMSQFAFSGSSLTLPLRIERQSSNALKLSEVLQTHSNVNWVKYPGLPSHPNHEIAKRQMKAFGGLVSLEVKGGAEGAKTFVMALKVACLTTGAGGIKTYVSVPYSFSHGPLIMNDEERAKQGVTQGMIRLTHEDFLSTSLPCMDNARFLYFLNSVGLENIEDLIADFTQALDRIANVPQAPAADGTSGFGSAVQYWKSKTSGQTN